MRYSRRTGTGSDGVEGLGMVMLFVIVVQLAFFAYKFVSNIDTEGAKKVNCVLCNSGEPR